jgi:transcriptional regulator with XRE-family HTH domain
VSASLGYAGVARASASRTLRPLSSASLFQPIRVYRITTLGGDCDYPSWTPNAHLPSMATISGIPNLMTSLPADKERYGFAVRLKSALRDGRFPATANAFAMEFNLRADGARVTVYAVRKWLEGTAIPTQEKIHIIAHWLGVSAQWLRYGESPETSLKDVFFEPRDFRLINDLRQLRQSERNLVEQMVEALLSARPVKH